MTELPPRGPYDATIPAFDGLAREIVCDESGATGDNLRDPQQRILVHASVDIGHDYAKAVMDEVRSRTGIRATELKSKSFLRPEHEEARQWLLGPEGPIARDAMVMLVDKDYMLSTKIVDTFIEEVQHSKGIDYVLNRDARRDARVLARLGSRAFGELAWNQFLDTFQSLMKKSLREGRQRASPDDFFEIVDRLRLNSRRKELDPIMALLWEAYPRRDELSRQPVPFAALDPLMTAVPTTARLWHEKLNEPIVLLHDEQSALDPDRVQRIMAELVSPHPFWRNKIAKVHLVGIRSGDSKLDPRIQVADLLAGVARDSATRALAGDPQPLQIGHFVGTYSLWADETSWIALTGRPYV